MLEGTSKSYIRMTVLNIKSKEVMQGGNMRENNEP